VQTAMKVLEKYFGRIYEKALRKNTRGLGLTDEQLKEVIQQIIKLNPKPGGHIGDNNKGKPILHLIFSY
jgi:RNA polymerase sigma-54 factor